MELTRKGLLALGLVSVMAGTVMADCSSGSCSTSCSTDCSTSCTPCGDSCKGDAHCKSEFLPFSQGDNRAYDYASVCHLQNLADQEDWNWHAEIGIEYNQNFDRKDLGSYFFPCSNTLTVSSNGASNTDIRNVDLGLSSTFSGTLTIKPRIRNIVIPISAYVGLDRWLEGAFLWFKLPIAHTRWELNCCEKITGSGGDFYHALFSPTGEPTNGLDSMGTATVTAVGSKNITDAFSGTKTWGDKGTGLKAARILCCEEKETGVADIPLHLGYNFVNKDKYMLGAYARVVFPTGSVTNRASIFDPRVGYDRWQVGGGLQGRARLYEKDEDTAVNLHADVYVTHIFKKKQCRVFDYAVSGTSSCLNRYLLMKEFDSNGVYTGRLFNFVDIFTLCAESKFDWNVAGLVFLELKHKAWTFDLGYEVKARACEDIDCTCLTLCDPCNKDCGSDCCDTGVDLKGKKYGIKGATSARVPTVTPVDSTTNKTSSKSNIRAVAGVDATATFLDASNIAANIDRNGARIPRALSHKVWGHLGYTWEDRDYPVFAGIGAEGEFGSHNTALSLWGIWGKVGVAYN